MHHEPRQTHHCHLVLVVLVKTEQIQLDHSHLGLLQVPILDHARKNLQIRQQLGMKSDHMVHQETCSPGRAGHESRPFHHKVQHRSYQHRIVGTGSYMLHSMGLNSTDGHMDSRFLVEVVGDDLIVAGQSEQHFAVDFELPGLELCVHCFGLLQLLHSGIELVDQNFVGIAMFRSEVQNTHCKIFEELKHLDGLVHLVAERIVVGSNCCSFVFVGQPCSKRNNRSGRRRKRQRVVESALARFGSDTLRMDFGTPEPVD